jgi:hypothetical protein
MGTFPKSESSILTLADEMINGLTNHSDIYPAPPVAVEFLSGLRDGFATARNGAVEAQATAQTATATKDETLEQLIVVMKRELAYAENTVGKTSEQLGLLGWSPRKTPTPQPAPGQSRLLTVVRQEESCVGLAWKAPDEGGKPSAYRVLRRERPEGPWQDVATAVETQVSLIDQPRGTEYEYRVVAADKADAAAPGNTVIVVL